MKRRDFRLGCQVHGNLQVRRKLNKGKEEFITLLGVAGEAKNMGDYR
jgi:hypothetical protein